MPLDSSLVGTTVGPVQTEVDARWAMAYAAALEDYLPCYLDTRRRDGIVAHPVFPVCFEWPAAGQLHGRVRDSKLATDEFRRAVHATYDIEIHREIRPPERVATTLTLVAVRRLRPGAYELLRFETADTQGRPVCTTWYGTIYRGVEVAGDDRAIADPPAPVAVANADSPRTEIPLVVSAGAAHVYTECARIFNPVHTDAAVAAGAGLPGIILHGTATMAMAVSKIVAAEAGCRPQRVRRIYGRFAAMVSMPSMVTVRVASRTPVAGGDAVSFEVLNADGGAAIRDGMVLLGE